MVNLRKNFDDLIDRFFREPVFAIPGLFSDESWYPTVDVSEGKREVVAKAEIPGVDKEGINISLDGRFVTDCRPRRSRVVGLDTDISISICVYLVFLITQLLFPMYTLNITLM